MNQAVERHVAPQQPGHGRPAQRGRHPRLGIERRQLDVSGHDGAGAGGNPDAKGRQLDLIQPLARMLDRGQTGVRVDVGIAVAGKVLEGRYHAALGESANVRRRETPDRLRRLAERTRVDDGIARVVVDVDDRRKVDMDADGARFETGDAPRLEREPVVAGGAERHRPRKRGGTGDAESDASLEVGGVQQRQCRRRLQPIEERRGLERLAEDHRAVRRIEQDARRGLRAEHVKAADVELTRQVGQILVYRAVRAHERGLERRHEQRRPRGKLRGAAPAAGGAPA